MQRAEFESWLNAARNLTARSMDSRLSTLRRVEYHEGDLDAHYDTDGMAGLMARLNPGQPTHSIPINGNVYNGTASLKSAVVLYRAFRDVAGKARSGDAQGVPINRSGSGAGPTRRAAVIPLRSAAKAAVATRVSVPQRGASIGAAGEQHRKPRPQEAETPWPSWRGPSDEDLLMLAQAMAPLVRFLSPNIISVIAEDNRRMRTEWSSRLEALGIDAHGEPSQR